MNRRFLPVLWILVWLNAMPAIAQENRYAIFFTNKSNSPYSINSPEEFLSERALARRSKNQVAIDASDLPVNPDYIQQIADIGAEVALISKWFNAVLVEATDAEITTIADLGIVNYVEQVAEGVKYSARTDKSLKSEISQLEQEIEETQLHETNVLQNDQLGVDNMHQAGFRGEGVMIAVMDAGFSDVDVLPYFQHLFDDQRIKDFYNFTTNNEDIFTEFNHGTRVLSCIAAYDEGVIVGTAPGADYVLYITEDEESEFRIEEYNWVIAAERADSLGVDLITTSLGYSTFDDVSMDYSLNDLDGNTAVISKGAKMAASKGILLVNSAGNLGSDQSWGLVSTPGDVAELITVGAITADSVKSGFSSTGPSADGRIKPDVVALGSSVMVGFNYDNNMALFSSGTSFSTPLVAGMIAGIIQAFPEKNREEIIEIVRSSSHQFDSPDNQLGYGIPNFNRAKLIVVGLENHPFQPIEFFPNPVMEYLHIKLGEEMARVQPVINVYNSLGQEIRSFKIIESEKPANITLDLQSLRPGLYVVQISHHDVLRNFRLIKE